MIARELVGDVAVLRMQHGKANALDTEFCEGLRAALAAERDGAARALVLTGSGSIFSAGVDLPRLLAGGRAYLEDFLPALAAALLELISHPLPVVAAINGHAIAGGCVLACACDRRLMVDGADSVARFGAPELSVGVPSPRLALHGITLATSPATRPELVLGGTLFEPAAALARVLLPRVLPAAGLDAAALAEAARLAAIPTVAFTATKAELTRAVLERWHADGAAAEAATLEAWSSEPVRRAIEAFVARTLGR